jgi:hypothetical protein
MSTSLVKELVLKDWEIMRVAVYCYWAGGFVAVALALLGGSAMGTAAFVLFVAAMAAAGVHSLIQTIVEERNNQNLPFIMSLPITVKEFTKAKMIVNLAIFTTVWLTLSGASLVIFVGDDGMPDGTLPFACIILLSIFLAYVLMLVVALLSGTMGPTIAATVVANIGTQMALWLVADLHGIRSVIGGPQAIWNGTSLGILAIELVVIVVLLVVTYHLQSRKRDFV